jgi:SNF2 family DNA or RNA helicase
MSTFSALSADLSGPDLSKAFFEYIDTHYTTLFSDCIDTKPYSIENERELKSFILLPSMNWASQFNLYKDIHIRHSPEMLFIQNQYNLLGLRYKVPDFVVSHHFIRLVYKFTSKILVLPCIRNDWDIYTNPIILKNNLFFIELNLINENGNYLSLQLNIKINKTLFSDPIQKLQVLENVYIRKFILEINQSIQLLQYNNILEQLENKIATKSSLDLNYNTFLKKRLFHYQLENIKWMKTIENKVRQNENIINYEYSLHDTIPELNCCVIKDKIYPIETVNDKLYYKNELHYYGGCLIDEMGLGKTLCMLTLIYQDLDLSSTQQHFKINTKLCHYKFKKGKNACEFCPNEIKKKDNDRLLSTFYCKLHEKNITELRRVEYNNELSNKNELVTLLPSNSRFVSHASVIICPSHLCEHWIRESGEFIHTWNIILISTFEQLKQLSVIDICQAELIIVSQNLLVNKKYRNLCKLQSGINLENVKDFKCPNLSLFKFKRLVFDECHELFKGNITLLSSISALSSTFRWLLSGTPFPHKLDSLVQNLILTTNSDLSLYHTTYSFTKLKKQGFFDNNFIQSLFLLYRKNTKDSVKHEIKDNAITHTTKWLEFTNTERSIYDSYSFGKSHAINFLLQLCCHPELYNQTKKLVKNCKTLTEIQDALLFYYQSKLDSLKKECDVLKAIQSDLEKKISESVNERETKKQFEQSLTSNIKTIKKIETEINSYNRTSIYLKSIVDTTNLNNFTCPICLESNTYDAQDSNNTTNLSMTICGHTFCSECLQTHLKDKNFCPQCRSDLSENECFIIKKENKSNSDDSNSNLHLEPNKNVNDIVEHVKSTKIGNIIHFVKQHISNSPQDKIIIFSQWESLLTKVQEYLSYYNIKSAFCKGSIFQKNKVIRSFKTSDMPILLLSSNLAASGLDLICANKVIFIEPIYGSKKYKKDIESQAIGRVDRIGQDKFIEIIRFFIKDTIEEKIHENNFEIF